MVLPASCTLIAPHQRTTSGGVYVLEELARHLAASAGEVNLAVRRGPIRPLAGVNVLEAPELSARELPDADVLIGGLAQPDPERVLALPASKGEPLFLFQGYGVPGNPRVTAMLERRPRVLAVSSYLAEAARAHGCAVELTRPGLDRALFHPEAPCAEREPVVTMMTHTTDWKATDDGLAAFAQVHAAMPDVELALFGAHRPETDLPTRFLGTLSRTGVAELLRRTCVFVCSSLEEGLGLPGLEALACGAALASTNTGGGRDYALHEETALVSAPGDPQALAQNVIRLLREPALRARLCQNGMEHALATYPPWPQATERFQQAITRLLDRAPATAQPAR
jgi:hypothetical protein